MLSASAASSLDHIERLAAKQTRLLLAQTDAEQAFLTALARDGLSEDELLDVYNRFRLVARPGFTVRWEGAFGVSPNGLVARGNERRANLPNGPDGRSWVGDVPVDPKSPSPCSGQAVVYVLYDASLTPCYVGSTHAFRTRLRSHLRDGKPAVSWTAYPCADREAAYALEDLVLRQQTPYLNVRAGR